MSFGKVCGQEFTNKCVYKYRVENGLSGNNVRSIYQDKLGFIWISTQDGLNRFDGKKFTHYSASSDPKKQIPTPDVRAVVEDADRGLLWATGNIGSLYAIDPLSGNIGWVVDAPPLNTDDWHITTTYSPHAIWVGSNHGVKTYDILTKNWARQVLPFTINKKGDLFAVRTLLTDNRKRVWAFVDHYGIVLFDGKQKKILDAMPLEKMDPTGLSEMTFSSALELSSDTLLVGTSMGLLRLCAKGNSLSLVQIDSNNRFPATRVCALTKTPDYVYVGTEQGLYQCDKKSWTYLLIKETGVREQEWFKSIQYLYGDRNKNIWVGCKEGLALVQNSPGPFECINRQEFPEAPKLDQLYFVLPNGPNFLICMQKGLVQYVPSRRQFITIDNKKAYNFSFLDHDSNVIVSSDEGLYILKGDHLLPAQLTHPEISPFSGSYINSAVPFGDSTFVIGTDNARGIFFWNFKKKKVTHLNRVSSPLRISSNIVNKVYKDRQGNLWVLSDLGVDVIDKRLKKVTPLVLTEKKTNTSPKMFFDMCETEKNIWLSAYGFGLLQLDKQGNLLEIYDHQEGLSVAGVYSIFNYQDKKILVSTNNGLSVFNLEKKQFHNYYEQDGLHSNGFEENCGIQHENRYILGGLNGYTVVNPALLQVNEQPPTVYINRITLESSTEAVDTSNLLIQHLEIPATVIRATLHLSVLHFTNPLRTKVMYQIKEISDNWIPVEGQDVISLMGMAPGTYTVQIKAANEHGFWNQVPTSITLRFLPKWYQTIWFQLAAVVLCLLIVYLLYRYRLQQLREQQEIRKSIASDLHDDLGSSLNTVKIFTHLAKKEKDNLQYLNEIEATLTLASASMRDMLWVLDDTKDSWKELFDRIQRFAAPILAAQSIALVLEIEEGIENDLLTKEQKRNLLLIAKEAINNSLKYAQCKTIKVAVTKAYSKKTFTVSDDGIGFDLSKSSEGNGRKNMLYRAKQIHYWLTVTSAPQKGTTVSLAQM